MVKHIAKTGAVTAAKRTMNFARHRPSFDTAKMLPFVLVLVLAVGGFAKFGILDPLNKKAAAYTDLSAKQEQLNMLHTRLLDFDALQQQYDRYSFGLMTGTEASLVSRGDSLALIEQEVAPYAAIESFAVNGNVLSLNLSGITLEDAGTMVSALEASPLVSRASILSATAEDGKNARIFISVLLSKEGGV